VCGDTQSGLNKHHIVPYVFRSRFPNQYKESNHHDIAATCVDCHENYEGFATQYKAQLAKECGVCINASLSKEQKDNKKIMSAKKLMQRINNGELRDNQGNIVIDAKRLEEIKEWAVKEPLEVDKASGSAWADAIMKKVLDEGKLWEFIVSWRKHFVEHARPQFLPQHWSVDSPLEIVDRH